MDQAQLGRQTGEWGRLIDHHRSKFKIFVFLLNFLKKKIMSHWPSIVLFNSIYFINNSPLLFLINFIYQNLLQSEKSLEI